MVDTATTLQRQTGMMTTMTVIGTFGLCWLAIKIKRAMFDNRERW